MGGTPQTYFVSCLFIICRGCRRWHSDCIREWPSPECFTWATILQTVTDPWVYFPSIIQSSHIGYSKFHVNDHNALLSSVDAALTRLLCSNCSPAKRAPQGVHFPRNCFHQNRSRGIITPIPSRLSSNAACFWSNYTTLESASVLVSSQKIG
jgi:hypothetical protein